MAEAFEDNSGKRDILLAIDLTTVLISTITLLIVGLLSGVVPALRASRLAPPSKPSATNSRDRVTAETFLFRSQGGSAIL